MRPPGPNRRIPLSDLTTLRPPNVESQLLPDGGRGSPVKSMQIVSYLPSMSFPAQEVRRHMPSALRNHDKAPLVTPETSPAQIDLSRDTVLEHLDASRVIAMELPIDLGAKPAYSYATLIGMAILRSPERKLTLSAIYNWISSSFSYYSHSEAGWQNSIRHNLSLNKAFVKVERPKDEPGKGHYWTIEAGCEGQFLKSRVVKKLSSGVSAKLSLNLKKDGKKRNVEFDDVPRMKKIMISPTENSVKYDTIRTMQVPASPPPTDDKRKKNSLWDYDDSGYFSPSDNGFNDEQTCLQEDAMSRSALYSQSFSYSANALDLVMSPPASSSPMRHDRTGIFGPRTPAPPVRRALMSSPGTCLREHRQQMVQMLNLPRVEAVQPLSEIEDDPWLTTTPKTKEISKSILDSPWDEVAERAAFGSPEKRESRRRESRRSLVSGLHAQELYEFDSISSMPGVNVLDIMKREVDKIKGISRSLRPTFMERSQSSLF